MDFSWVKQLAEESNQAELKRQEEERRKQEESKMMALATIPFVEKLFMLINACIDEFNKHCMFPDLKISISKLTKKSKTVVHDSELEEVAYFTFTRKNWMYGIRGINGIVEFCEFPVTEGAASLSFKLDELGMEASYKLISKVDFDLTDSSRKQVLWTLNSDSMDGPKLVSLCQQYLSDFVSNTNPTVSK